MDMDLEKKTVEGEVDRGLALSFSTGKDAAFALSRLIDEGRRPRALLTTLSADYRRVTMHGVSERLVDLQAAAIGLPLIKVYLPNPSPNEIYEQLMASASRVMQRAGISRVAFGDLCLEDIKRYREATMERAEMEAVFPIFGVDTAAVSREIIASGIEARVICVDLLRLDRSFLGRVYDEAFLNDLPAGIDPAGENGEFHTFVFNAPYFDKRVEIQLGEIVERDGFAWLDLLPAE